MTVSPHSTQKEADVDSSAVTCPKVGSSASEDWAVGPVLGCCMWWTSWPCFTSICNLQITAVSLSLFFFFNKWKVCGNPGPSRSLGTIFPAAFAPLMSLPHFGNSRSISHFTYHYYICYVVSDLCSTTTHWSLRWWLAFFKSWSISKLKYVHFFQTVLLYTSQPVV